MNKGKNIVIAILVVIVLGFGSFIVYDKVLRKDEINKETVNNQPKEDQNTKTEENTFPYKLEERKQSQVLSLPSYFNMNVYVTKEGEVYLFLNELDSALNIDKNIIENFKKVNETYGAQDYNLDIANNKMIKLDLKDVLYAYQASMGQDIAGSYFLFIKTDGSMESLSIADIMYESTLTFKKLDLKNIISFYNSSTPNVLAGSGAETIAVDSQGKEYNVFDYLK